MDEKVILEKETVYTLVHQLRQAKELLTDPRETQNKSILEKLANELEKQYDIYDPVYVAGILEIISFVDSNIYMVPENEEGYQIISYLNGELTSLVDDVWGIENA